MPGRPGPVFRFRRDSESSASSGGSPGPRRTGGREGRGGRQDPQRRGGLFDIPRCPRGHPLPGYGSEGESDEGPRRHGLRLHYARTGGGGRHGGGRGRGRGRFDGIDLRDPRLPQLWRMLDDARALFGLDGQDRLGGHGRRDPYDIDPYDMDAMDPYGGMGPYGGMRGRGEWY
ncbi:hypothetical protein SVAN01_01219 [Stagonosporopsis vannaccii]|nr:hypothetical protein SVAN01_01219 [Stagonosporopsis vannaccii]